LEAELRKKQNKQIYLLRSFAPVLQLSVGIDYN